MKFFAICNDTIIIYCLIMQKETVYLFEKKVWRIVKVIK